MTLISTGWCDFMQADLLIWADPAGWTGWKVMTFLDEWKIARLMVVVEVERVKRVVVCPSVGTVVCLECF